MRYQSLILNSGVCNFGGCFFCGYGKLVYTTQSTEDLKQKFDRFFENFNSDGIKVFGSGSFFDEKQIPADARNYFIKACKKKKPDEVIVESRPEHITSDKLQEFAGINLSIAIGLETADKTLLKKINKGFSLADFEKAAKLIHSLGFKVRSYLIVNLPFSKDYKRALATSVKYALIHCDSVVLINLLPHSDAELFRMWINGEWNYLTVEEFNEATLRWHDDVRIEIDPETFNFIPKFPKNLKEDLIGVGEEYLTHPHFEVWQDYLIRWYRPPSGKTLLILPCSYKKPYSASKTHKGIINVLQDTGTRYKYHEVMVSNAGVVPREFEDLYPFNTYDWDESLETEEIKQRYIQVTAQRITKYLEKHGQRYDSILCFFKYDSESYKALEKASEKLGITVRNLLNPDTYDRIKNNGQPLSSKEALNDIRDNIRLWLQQDSTL